MCLGLLGNVFFKLCLKLLGKLFGTVRELVGTLGELVGNCSGIDWDMCLYGFDTFSISAGSFKSTQQTNLLLLCDCITFSDNYVETRYTISF